MKTAKRDQLMRKSLLIEDMNVPEVDATRDNSADPQSGNTDEPALPAQRYIDTIPPQQGTAAPPTLVDLTEAGSRGSIDLLHAGSGDGRDTQPAYDPAALVQQRLNNPRASLTAKVQAVYELKQQRPSAAHPLRMSAPVGGMRIRYMHDYVCVRGMS